MMRLGFGLACQQECPPCQSSHRTLGTAQRPHDFSLLGSALAQSPV